MRPQELQAGSAALLYRPVVEASARQRGEGCIHAGLSVLNRTPQGLRGVQ